MATLEKIHKICCRIMCLLPFVFSIISQELNIPDNIKNFVWLAMLIIAAILILVPLTMFKATKKSEKFWGTLALILLIGSLTFSY